MRSVRRGLTENRGQNACKDSQMFFKNGGSSMLNNGSVLKW
jgi:hypothetical protein